MTPARPGSLADTLNQSHGLTERFRKERDEAVELLREAHDTLFMMPTPRRRLKFKIAALLERIGK